MQQRRVERSLDTGLHQVKRGVQNVGAHWMVYTVHFYFCTMKRQWHVGSAVSSGVAKRYVVSCRPCCYT